MKYDHKKIEIFWQKVWDQEGIYKAEFPSKKQKYYLLIEFPYPSGERLHVGHARSYSAMDAIARKRRMQGYNVLYPFGWDAFGLPAENYAIKTGIHPSITTKKNIANAKKQVKSWGLSFDWTSEINTTDPKYYKWTQWIFIQLFKHGLAYRAEIPVNWCLSCKINLANEEVIEGRCERCGGETQRRMQKQWMLKITKYAQRLLDDLEKINYRQDIKQQQINWIGRSEGAIIKFQVKNEKLKINVFTTRIDTLFGATALIIAPDKMIGKEYLALKISSKEQHNEIKDYIKISQNKSELERCGLKEKTGVFTGAYVLNPINDKPMPVWVADYVVGWYGEGAVMLVPAHDERDFEFAQKYGIKIKQVIKGKSSQKIFKKPFIEDGVLINSDKYNGLESKKAREIITQDGEKAGWAKSKITYKLRDWVFSRQHYWGEPIPIIHCCKCGGIPVPDKDLPVKLPHVKNYQPTQTGESPLASIAKWVNTKCPECGGPGKRETDTMPNWAGSSWYFLRYCDPDNNSSLADIKKLQYWLPINWYNGGLEHTTLHLLYSRFWHKFLFDIGVVPTNEPYAKRTSHGVVLGPDGQKMSKSRGNVINPEEVVEKYGADTLRIYEMFMGPFEEQIAWSEEALAGVRRFLDRVWRIYQNPLQIPDLGVKLHQTIKKVSEDIEELKFNTAIAVMMEFVNDCYKEQPKAEFVREDAETFLRLLAPFAPHLTEALYQKNFISTGKFQSIHTQSWPEYNPVLIKEEAVEFVIQVNGKVRDRIKVTSQESEIQTEVEKIIKKNSKVNQYLLDKKIRKTIFVPGKLINFVVS